MFEDRLEIYSPGTLPNTVTIDSISLRQATRNELITNLLTETPVAERSAMWDVVFTWKSEARVFQSF